MKHLLLCAVLKVTEWKECSEQVRRSTWNEITGALELYPRILYGVLEKASVSM